MTSYSEKLHIHLTDDENQKYLKKACCHLKEMLELESVTISPPLRANVALPIITEMLPAIVYNLNFNKPTETVLPKPDKASSLLFLRANNHRANFSILKLLGMNH
jgi:hypothetical protein